MIRFSLVILFLLTGVVRAAPLQIRPDPKAEWRASLADVKAVLNSAGSELCQFFPGVELRPIEVAPKGGPIVHYKRGPHGEYRVKLNTEGLLWAQYSYQFSHELCHILCRYDQDSHPNKWFEESICELASIFALRGMAKTWETRPPYPNWKSYSKALHSYAQDLIDKGNLPPNTSLSRWFQKERSILSEDATLREKNRVVAIALLGMFEAHPEHWNAVHFLNVAPSTSQKTFEEYLHAWRNNAPYRHHRFIEAIAAKFGVKLPA